MSPSEEYGFLSREGRKESIKEAGRFFGWVGTRMKIQLKMLWTLERNMIELLYRVGEGLHAWWYPTLAPSSEAHLPWMCRHAVCCLGL